MTYVLVNGVVVARDEQVVSGSVLLGLRERLRELKADRDSLIAHIAKTKAALAEIKALDVTGTVTATAFAGPLTHNVTAAITAGTTQTQAGATALTKDVNEISTCANANDGVKLPTAVGGQQITIVNNGAQTARVWPFSGDDNGAGVDTQITLPAGSVMTCTDYTTTSWRCTSAAKVTM